MSLRPQDSSSRARSRSRDGRDDRDRSRPDPRVSKAPSPPSASHYVSSMPGSFTNGSSNYEVRAPAASDYSVPYPHENGYAKQNHGYGSAMFPDAPDSDDDLAYGHDSGRQAPSRHASYTNARPGGQYPGQFSNARDQRYVPQPDLPPQNYNYQYAQPPDRLSYSVKPETRPVQYEDRDYRQVQHKDAEYRQIQHKDSEYRPVMHEDRDSRKVQLDHEFRPHASRSYSDDSYRREGANIVDITPGPEQRKSSHRLSIGAQPSHAPPSPGLHPQMDRLSIAGQQLHNRDGGAPPASPLLEAYHGTYQSVSPMALALRPKDDDDLSDLELDTVSSRTSLSSRNDKLSKEAHKSKDKSKSKDKDKDKKEKKRVILYDAEEDAKKIATSLKHSKPDGDGIIDTLPALSHDNIMELRKEYKKQVKIQGKGINLPKHLNLKVSGNFGKAAYVTALGRWESEGYWANFWYQSHGARRELLIESLMGRSNTEIRYIKDEFKDKRYSDSLVRCMEKELKMDKFRSAVLMVLEERRQEEQDVYPLEYRSRDVEVLHQALTSRQGGETAMLDVVVRRSDSHLRDVLSGYQNIYGENFARAALKKSNNLVGEVIAHILNGVINKPARDALLIHHAIQDIADHNKSEELRYELLISRLIRVHWDKLHLQRVKREYADKFRRQLQQDIEEATKGDFREFMCELCEVRNP